MLQTVSEQSRSPFLAQLIPSLSAEKVIPAPLD